jgi:predicted NBD/HSP70 family sugar kinase
VRALDLPDELSLSEVRAALVATHVSQALHDVERHLETGLINLVNTLAPDRVVFSGLLADIAAAFADQLSEALNRSVVAQHSKVALSCSTMQDNLLLGAAEMAFERVLHDPDAVMDALVAG